MDFLRPDVVFLSLVAKAGYSPSSQQTDGISVARSTKVSAEQLLSDPKALHARMSGVGFFGRYDDFGSKVSLLALSKEETQSQLTAFLDWVHELISIAHKAYQDSKSQDSFGRWTTDLKDEYKKDLIQQAGSLARSVMASFGTLKEPSACKAAVEAVFNKSLTTNPEVTLRQALEALARP